MATDLKKMVEEWWNNKWGSQHPFTLLPTHRLFLAMAAEIEDNREEIEKLKGGIISEEEIEELRKIKHDYWQNKK